jgi:hypothetical protein
MHKRVIQQVKCGKVQLDPVVQNAILGDRGGAVRLGDIGGFAGLMKSKEVMVPRLLAEIAYQCRNTDKEDGWVIHNYLTG